MSDSDPNGLAATLLSVSFLRALRVGAIAGRLGGILIGTGTGAHALIGAVAGRKPSQVLTALVVGAGFWGFGALAQTAGS